MKNNITRTDLQKFNTFIPSLWERMNESSSNSNTLKVYKQLTHIETFDGEVYVVDQPLTNLEKLLNNNKFLNLWNEAINTASIKRVFIKEVDEVDNALINISDKNLRSRVRAEVEKRRKDWYRVNMDVYKNILDRLSK